MCCVLVTQLCWTLCYPRDCGPPGSSVRGILQARILEWVAISFFRGSSRPRDWTLRYRQSLCHLSLQGSLVIMLINKNNNYQVSSTHFVPSTLHRPSHLIFTTVLRSRFYLCPMWMRKSRLREITNLYTSHRYQGVGFQSRFHLTPEVEHILVKSLNFSELKFFCSIHLTSRVAIIIQGNNVYKGLRPLTRSQ